MGKLTTAKLSCELAPFEFYVRETHRSLTAQLVYKKKHNSILIYSPDTSHYVPSMSSMHCSCSSPVLVLWLLLLVSSTQASGGSAQPVIPILARLTKDPATSLYSITIKHGDRPLVVDLAGPLLWSRCPPVHRTVPCINSQCKAINKRLPANKCTTAYSTSTATHPSCVCKTYPYNPVTGQCAEADATTFTLSASGTNGASPLFPVTFMASGSCAPERLFTPLPAGSWGVAGLSRLPQSLPTQVASVFKVRKEFALCFPRGGVGSGAAIFGGGPFELLMGPPVEMAADIRRNQLPLLRNPRNGAYYFRVTDINVDDEAVALPPGALDLDARTGTGGVMFSTVTPYTTLRPDVYRALLGAFDAATSGIPRAPPAKPFERCYPTSALVYSRLGFAVANIDLLLDDGHTWLIPGGTSLVQVDHSTVCFAFLEMSSSTPPVPGSPAVMFGGFQLEDYLILFDLEKETFGFSGPLAWIRTSCSSFNFTMAS
jgi:hypothetical protein